MSITIPAERMQLSEDVSKQYAAIFRLSRSIELYRERAAPELGEAISHISDGHVLDEEWEPAR